MNKNLYHAAVVLSKGTQRSSKSKYAGGFQITNNRVNNTKAYNHDYYMKNKDKWKKYNNKDKKKTSWFEDLWEQLKDGTIWDSFTGSIDDLFARLFGRTATVDSIPVDSIPASIKPSSTVEKPGETAKENTLEVYAFDFGDPSKQFKKKPKDARDLYYDKYHDVLNSKNPRHKYIYKVMGANHKYRYFYSYAEYYKFMEKVPQKNREYSIAEDMSAVNKLYTNTYKDNSEDDYLYKQNCGFCTMAYDLRRRGYDVQAIPMPGYGIGNDTIADLYETKNHEKVTQSYISPWKKDDGTREPASAEVYTDRLFDAFEQGGSGSSGEVHVDWFGGGGHSMAYQVVDGKGYVLDCQTNTMYDREDYAKLIAPHVSCTGYTRLDDKVFKTDNPNDPAYKRAVARQKITKQGETIFDNEYAYDVVTYDENNVGTFYQRNHTVKVTKAFDTTSTRNPGEATLDTYKLFSFLPDKEKIVSYTVEDAPNNDYHSRPIVTGAGGSYRDEEGYTEKITTRTRTGNSPKGRK